MLIYEDLCSLISVFFIPYTGSPSSRRTWRAIVPVSKSRTRHIQNHPHAGRWGTMSSATILDQHKSP